MCHRNLLLQAVVGMQWSHMRGEVARLTLIGCLTSWTLNKFNCMVEEQLGPSRCIP